MNEDWKVRELTEALRRSEANAAKDRAYIEQLRLELDKHRWISVGEETIPDGKLLRVKIKNFDVETFGFYDKELGKWRCAVPGAEVTHYQSMTFPDTITQTK